MDKSSKNSKTSPNTDQVSIFKKKPTRWADYPSDDEIIFKMEIEGNSSNGENKKSPDKKEEKQDSPVTIGDDSSPVRSESAKASPIDIHSKTE